MPDLGYTYARVGINTARSGITTVFDLRCIGL